jgi:uncharacterized membrane-anchored protein
MKARGLELTSEKWAPFAAILTVLGAVATNLEAVWESLKQMFVLVLVPLSAFSESARAQLRSYVGDEIDGEMLAILIVAAAVYLALFVFVVRGLWRAVPKIWGDLKKIAAFVREWRRGRAPS